MGHWGTVLLVWPRSGGRLKQGRVSCGAQGLIYSVLAVCRGRLFRHGDGGSRHAALLIGLHRLRPANSEHQWAETDWASWVTKSHSSSSFVCQKRVFLIPQANVVEEKVWDSVLKETWGREISSPTLLESILKSLKSPLLHWHRAEL